MGRSKNEKQIEGQQVLGFCLEPQNYVVQSKELIGGKQALKINSAKLVRSAIMQIKYEDKELKPYFVTIPQLAKLFGISESNLYRDIDDITNDILQNPVQIKKVIDGKNKFLKLPWVSYCAYDEEVGVMIKLNNDLKPYLLGLREHYTQYQLDTALTMKSVYAIRMFEILYSKVNSTVLPKEGTYIELSLTEIREGCDCESETYDKISNLRNRVIDVALKEINEKTLYNVSYTKEVDGKQKPNYIKNGATVVGIIFHINMCYH